MLILKFDVEVDNIGGVEIAPDPSQA